MPYSDISNILAMRPPLGSPAQLLYADQSAAKLKCLELIDALPDDPEVPGFERALVDCMRSVAAALSGVAYQPPSNRQKLLILVESQLRSANKAIIPKLLNHAIPNKRRLPGRREALALSAVVLAYVVWTVLPLLTFWQLLLCVGGLLVGSVLLITVQELVFRAQTPHAKEALVDLLKIRADMKRALITPVADERALDLGRYERLRQLAAQNPRAPNLREIQMLAAHCLLLVYVHSDNLEALQRLRRDAEEAAASSPLTPDCALTAGYIRAVATHKLNWVAWLQSRKR